MQGPRARVARTGSSGCATWTHSRRRDEALLCSWNWRPRRSSEETMKTLPPGNGEQWTAGQSHCEQPAPTQDRAELKMGAGDAVDEVPRGPEGQRRTAGHCGHEGKGEAQKEIR